MTAGARTEFYSSQKDFYPCCAGTSTCEYEGHFSAVPHDDNANSAVITNAAPSTFFIFVTSSFRYIASDKNNVEFSIFLLNEQLPFNNDSCRVEGILG